MFQEKKKRAPRFVAIAAGKGGVGKSTVAVNLALALRKLGFTVGILDADLYGPSIRRMLPEERFPAQEGESLIPALSHGIETVSMAYFRGEGEAAAVRAPVANKIVSQFLQGTRWGDLDYLLIDFPPGTGDIQLTLAQQVPFFAALLVTTPQQVAVMDVRKAAALFRQTGIPLAGVIENMAYLEVGSEKVFPFGRGGGAALAEELGIAFFGSLPLDPLLCQASDKGLSLFEHPEPPLVTTLFLEYALKLHRFEEPPHLALLNCKEEKGVLILSWNDTSESCWPLSTLQQRCTCAGCQENPPSVAPDVGVREVHNAGRYALKMVFNSGCSKGIYPFAMLKEGP